MWVALIVAVGIGVVWAGGKKTTWWTFYETPWHERDVQRGIDMMRSDLYLRGRPDGVAISHMTEDQFGHGLRLPMSEPREWWWPVWEGRWPDCGLWIPYWIPTLLCLATFALLFRVERREKRLARAGHCVCGYSLAGLTDGAVCPECGKGNGAS